MCFMIIISRMAKTQRIYRDKTRFSSFQGNIVNGFRKLTFWRHLRFDIMAFNSLLPYDTLQNQETLHAFYQRTIGSGCSLIAKNLRNTKCLLTYFILGYSRYWFAKCGDITGLESANIVLFYFASEASGILWIVKSILVQDMWICSALPISYAAHKVSKQIAKHARCTWLHNTYFLRIYVDITAIKIIITELRLRHTITSQLLTSRMKR